MNLDKILQMWSVDSKIDEILLDESSLKIPSLHSKYLTLYSQFKLLLHKAEAEKRKISHMKTLYYSGKALPEVYEEMPFEYKVIKSDVPSWVMVDDAYVKVEEKIHNYEVILDTLSDIIKQIHQMSYTIGNIIKWRVFAQGG